MPWLMLWAVSCQPLSVEAQLQAQVFPVGFMVDKMTRFFESALVYPVV